MPGGNAAIKKLSPHRPSNLDIRSSTKTVVGLLLVVMSFFRLTGAELEEWEVIGPPRPLAGEITGLAFGNGTFVAVDYDGRIFHSEDGKKWVRQSVPVSTKLRDVEYLNGRFVAVGDKTLTWDGQRWQQTNPGLTQALTKIVAGNGWFVATAIAGVVARSQDGIIWQNQIGGQTPTIGALSFGNGVFAGAGGGYAYSSFDGADWQRSTGVRNLWGQPNIVFLFDKFYTSSDTRDRYSLLSSEVWTSVNGLDWYYPTNRTMPFPFESATGNGTAVMTYYPDDYHPFPRLIAAATTNGSDWVYPDPDNTLSNVKFERLAFGNGTFVAGNRLGMLATSTNGLNWEDIAPRVPSPAVGAAFGNGHYVFVGNDVTHSTNLVNLTSNYGLNPRQPPSYSAFSAVAYGGGRFVAGGFGGTLIWSPDGEKWGACSNHASTSIRAMAFGKYRFVAVGDGGVITVSTNGIEWQEIATNTTAQISAVIYGENQFVAIGTLGFIMTSSDGIHWARQTAPEDRLLSSIAYGDGRYIAVGSDGYSITSTNGTHWTKLAIDPRIKVAGGAVRIAYGGGRFVIVATQYPDFLYSYSFDGLTWTTSQLPPRVASPHIAYMDNSFFLLHGMLKSAPVTSLHLSMTRNQTENALDFLSRGGEPGLPYAIQSSSSAHFDDWTTIGTFTQSNATTKTTVLEPPRSHSFFRALKAQ